MKKDYTFEPCIQHLSETEKTRLCNLFHDIAKLRIDYIYELELDDKAEEKGDDWINLQLEIRKNVDEAIFQTIKENNDVLFVKYKGVALFRYLLGSIKTNTFLPKTLEYIVKHETASLVVSKYDLDSTPEKEINILWWNFECTSIVKWALENPKLRKTLHATGANIGMYALNHISFDIFDTYYREKINDLLEIIDRSLDYEDLAIYQQEVTGYNIGFLCVSTANKLLKKYIKRFGGIFLKDDSDNPHWIEKEKEFFEEIIKRLERLAYKSMITYPITGVQSNWEETTLNKEYGKLRTNFRYLGNPEQELTKDKKAEEAAKLEALKEATTTEVLIKRLTRK